MYYSNVQVTVQKDVPVQKCIALLSTSAYYFQGLLLKLLLSSKQFIEYLVLSTTKCWLPPATAKQQHRLVSFSPEQTNANGRYSHRTETLVDVTECEHNG